MIKVTSEIAHTFVWKLYLTFTSVLCVIIIVGNTLTIIAVHKTETLPTITNKLIVSRAAADLTIICALVLKTIRIILALS